MQSVRVSDLPSTSKSSRLTSYVVITFSSAVAIAFTSLQESASSVPPWSALQPPNDGITSPAGVRFRRDWMSDTYAPDAGVRALSPFHASVQELFPIVSR